MRLPKEHENGTSVTAGRHDQAEEPLAAGRADDTRPSTTRDEGAAADLDSAADGDETGNGNKTVNDDETVDAGDAESLQQRVDELEALNRDLSDRYMRLAAEFDNFRRRTRQNEQSIRATAAEAVLVDLLPVLDNLQLAIDAAGDAMKTPFGQGVSLIRQQLDDVLRGHGLTPIAATGQPFDPNTMEAVARAAPDDDVPDGHVIEEYRRGYKLHDKLIRASQVKVAQAQ